jgi:uncharacterized membrane protein (UPF0127 family)
MSKKLYIWIFGCFALLVVFFAAALWRDEAPQQESTTVKVIQEKTASVTFKNTTVKVDVADTEALHRKGLSGRTALPEGEGMWFVYEKNGVYSYWMPDMHFPIDIIWFDENFRAVYFQENATPESYPDIFTPTAPARYVLEVPAGFVKENAVILGDSVSVKI